MKTSLCSFLLGLLLCSCASFERAGLAMPTAKSTENLEVVDSGFVLKPRSKVVVLSIEVDIVNHPGRAKFLRVLFPNSETKIPSETKTEALGNESKLRLQSSPMSKLEYLEAYPIVVQLVEDAAGERVLDELTQYVRFEVPPQALKQMGVSL